MAATKPVPPKPVSPAAPPKPTPPAAPPRPAVPAAAPPKPATPPVAKAAPPAPKPATPVKPAAPGPAAPPKPATPPVAKAAVSREEFDTLVDTVNQLTDLVNQLVSTSTGYGDHVTVDEQGNITLDLENADEETIRNWAYQFNACDWNADAEAIRAHMISMRSKKGFQGWIAANELPRPAAAGSEGDGEEEISLEAINAMNASQLKELAGRIELDVSDNPSPKILRERIISALGGGEQGDADTPQLEIGAALVVTHPDDPNTTAAGTFAGYDENGSFIVDVPEWKGQFAFDADHVALAE